MTKRILQKTPCKDKFFNLSSLKERGWTPKSIKIFLGNCDLEKQNPIYKNASPMKFFLKERVFDAELSIDFKNWFEKTIKQREVLSQKLKHIADKKRQSLLQYIKDTTINIPIFNKDVLYQNAVAHYNDLWSMRGKDKWADLDAGEEFLHRISVNMLRHHFSIYESELDKMFGKIGVAEGYFLLKTKILDAIAKQYDYLSGECHRQKVEYFH